MAEDGGSGGGEKTQAPTQKRLEKAREEGNVAQSKELLLLVSLGAFLLVFAINIPQASRHFMHQMSQVFISFGLIPNDSASIYNMSMESFWAGMNFMAPIVGTGMCVVLIVGVLQTGFLFRPESLKPDITKLSPIKGIKRIFGLNNIIELLKTIAKIIVFGVILYKVALQTVDIAPQTERWTPYYLLDQMKDWFLYAAFMALAVQCAIAGFDELWSRYHRLSKLRMSFQDIKDETKQTEGDPQIKGRIRQIRQARSRRRIKKAVQEATVVLVNPTHYSVAIAYDQNSAQAPKVVAKGTDEMAFRIRTIAKEADVPVVSNPPLARSLYTLKLDTEIPEEFWKPVAVVIAYIVRLKTPGSRSSSLS